MPQFKDRLHNFEIGNVVAITYKCRGEIIKIREAAITAIADNCIRVRFCDLQCRTRLSRMLSRVTFKLLHKEYKWISLEDKDIVVSRCQEI